MLWHIIDMAEYCCKALLLLYLCKNLIEVKEKYRSVGRILFFMPVVAVNYLLSGTKWFDDFLYGKDTEVVQNSSQSIIKLVVIFVCSFVLIEIFFQGGRLAKLYLLLLFYGIQEMSRFALHGVWSLGNNAYIEYLNRRIFSGELEPEQFYPIIRRWEYTGAVLFAAGYLLIMLLTISLYKRYCRERADEIGKQGLCFLMLTPVIGMALDIALRVIFYRQVGGEIDFLYERHGSMYVVVPVISVLCLISVVYSRKIYSDLILAEEEKNSLLFYKQQLSDMTEHVKEMEQLYDGIRGMRHDVNNYVADMEQLLSVSIAGGDLSAAAEAEAKGYLKGMEQAVSALFEKFSTGNPVTDVILNRKWQVCERENIMLNEDFLYPEGMGIEAFDLGILMNNALDNAIEACRNVPEQEKRSIAVTSCLKGKMFFFIVENTFAGRLSVDRTGALRTTKKDSDMHGLGMHNMRSCVEKYYGTMQYRVKENRFILTIMLQGR